MGNLRRRDLPDGYFHVTARGVHGSNVFLVDLDRLDFIHLLGRVAARFDVRVFGRCLMDTHYHLVVEAVTSRLSEAMQQLNSTYALRFNKRHARRGHVFAERFSSWVIRDEEHFEAALQYLVDNPAKAGSRGRRNTRWTFIDLDQCARRAGRREAHATPRADRIANSAGAVLRPAPRLRG